MLEGYLGLSDVPSLAKILGRIAPRSLLLVGGGTAQLSQLAAACSSQLSKQQTKIVTPGGHCAVGAATVCCTGNMKLAQ